MFTKEEILAQLRDGTDASAIAQKMADEINAAIAEYSEEQNKASQKRAEAEAVVAALLDFLEKYYGVKRTDDDLKNVTDLVIGACDSTLEMLNTIEKAAKNAPTDDDVIKAWLNALK